MPKNVKKQRNNRSRQSNELRFRDKKNLEEYAVITSAKGNCRFGADIIGGDSDVIVSLKNTIKKGPFKEIIKPEDYVLLQLDENTTTKKKYFVIHKYSKDEAKQLERLNEFTYIENSNNDKVLFDNEEEKQKQQEAIFDETFIDDI